MSYAHSENVELYVIDSGSEDHPQFQDRQYCGYDPLDGDCRDQVGHGTHVATTAAVSAILLCFISSIGPHIDSQHNRELDMA